MVQIWNNFGSYSCANCYGSRFFLVVTPIGFTMRIIGKDLLRKKFDKKKETYWIKREKSVSTMKQQF